MPDWNSDKEGHVRHKWIVQKAFPDGDLGAGINTSKGVLIPNKQGRMLVNDPALAHEIRMEHPHDMTVTRMRYPDEADRGHRYHFGSWPEMPWKKKAREEQLPEGQESQAEAPEEVQEKPQGEGE